MAHKCQSPAVLCSSGQQFTPTPVQGFNVHVPTFAPVQHQVTAPMMSQPVMPEPMPSFSQASHLPRAHMLANGRTASKGMAQGSVATPMASTNVKLEGVVPGGQGDNPVQPRCR